MLGLGLGFGKLSSYKYTVKKLIDDYIKRVTAAGGYLEGNECATAKVRELNSQRLLDNASWLLIPEGIKEDVVYAQKPTNGNGDLTFTRASDATRTNSAGVIERTPWNLVTFSEMFSDASWTKSSGGTGVIPSVTPNTSTAPNGTLTADRIQFNCNGTTFSDRSILFQTFASAVVGRSYTFTIYIKANAPSEVGKQLRLNIDNGTTGQQIITITADWTRYTFVATSATSTVVNCVIETRGTVTTNTTADVLLWGAQLVEGTDAKPYFATTNRQDVPRLDYRNADGSLNSCPRLLLEPQRTNSIRNSTIVGVVLGSPGTVSTNWGQLLIGGLTRTVVGTGTENGLSYVDIRYNGTATGTSVVLSFETFTGITASTGQVWTGSFYAKTIASSPNSFRSIIIEYTSVGGYVTETNLNISVSSTLNRVTHTHTLAGGATVGRVLNGIVCILTIGQTYDFTIRIAAPQMELGAYATTFIPTTTAAATRVLDGFTRTNIFTNGLISSAGGTWFVDLSNNSVLTRDGVATGLFLDTSNAGFVNGLNIRNSGGSARYNISKWQSGTGVSLYTTLTDNVKIAIKWNGSIADVFVNGVKVVAGSAFTPTDMQFLNCNAAAGVPYFINQSALFPVPLTEAQLVDLTGGRVYYNPVEAYYAYYLTPEIPSAVITSVNSFF